MISLFRENSEHLAKQIVFDSNMATVKEVTEYGTKYNQNIVINGANGKQIEVTFAWIESNVDGYIRLVTGFPAK